MLLCEAAEVVANWQPTTICDQAAAFARAAVDPQRCRGGERAKALLWATGRLASFCASAGLPLETEVVFSEASIERFISLGCTSLAPATVRTLRTNLRAVARMADPNPPPAALPRHRAPRPYGTAEIAAYLALADAQPTASRRHRASGLIALCAGAGLTSADLRTVVGQSVVCRSGGVVVCVTGPRARTVPVRDEFASRALAAAAWAGTDFLIGGTEPTRKNVTWRLVTSLSGGNDLPRLSLPRCRSTWLARCATDLGLATFLAAAGITCSQHLGDVVAGLDPGGETEAVALLSGQ